MTLSNHSPGKSMMKILVLPYTHTLSHISRPLVVAKELRKRGHDIIFAGHNPKDRFIKNEGFEVLALDQLDPGELFGRIRKGELRFIKDEELEKMVEDDRKLFKEVQPDLVLTDGRFSAPLSTGIENLKHAAIVNVSSTEYRALPYIPFFAWIPSWLIKQESNPRMMLDILNLKLEMFVFDNTTSIFKRLSKKYNLHNMVTATNCLTGKDITLLADISEYFPTRNLPANYHYIGPLTWKSTSPLPSWWPPEKNDKPLIYVTMGTTGISDFFHKAYELFKASEMTAIITTGAQVSDLTNINGKIYVEPFIDGDLAMEASDLVVCHGGNGTIYQALQHGKPIIGIPTIPDQKFNMRRVESLGIGRMLSWEQFVKEPESLLELIKAIKREKSFYQNASRMRDILNKYKAGETAANIILSI
jgi:UDP:flavonoid glycosyltransferase YjiC (YdhE family)